MARETPRNGDPADGTAQDTARGAAGETELRRGLRPGDRRVRVARRRGHTRRGFGGLVRRILRLDARGG